MRKKQFRKFQMQVESSVDLWVVLITLEALHVDVFRAVCGEMNEGTTHCSWCSSDPETIYFVWLKLPSGFEVY